MSHTNTLVILDAAGTQRPATAEEVIAAGREHLSRWVRRGCALTSPQATRDYLALKLGTLDHEVFAVMLLTVQHQVIEYVELFRGTIDGASVHPREVVKEALIRGAAAAILVQSPLGRGRAVAGGRADHPASAGSPATGRHPDPRSRHCRRRGDVELLLPGLL